VLGIHRKQSKDVKIKVTTAMGDSAVTFGAEPELGE
jgi:hypothetical protein